MLGLQCKLNICFSINKICIKNILSSGISRNNCFGLLSTATRFYMYLSD